MFGNLNQIALLRSFSLFVCYAIQELDRVKSELLVTEEKAAVLEAQQAKSVEELEQQFRKEMETLQEYLKSQEKEYIAEIEKTRVGFLNSLFLLRAVAYSRQVGFEVANRFVFLL